MNPHAVTYLLVPGAGGDSWYWHLVAARLREGGHEVLSPDLPCGDDAAGLDDYADVVVAAAGTRPGVILVAQSMAAFIAPAVCARADVALLALVAPMIPAPGETPGAWWANSGQEQAKRELDLREGRDPDASFDPVATFLHDLPDDVLAAALSRGEPRQSATPFADRARFERWPDVPTVVLAGRHDRLLPLELVRSLAAERLGVAADVIDAGHLPALSRAGELTRWLEDHRLTAT